MDPSAPLATVLDPQGALARAGDFVVLGGPAMWAIALLSVATLTLILWKVMQLLAFGAWSGGRHTKLALDQWTDGQHAAAMATLAGRTSLRARHAYGAMQATANPAMDREGAGAEATRIGRALLAQARTGLRGLELAATVGPLLGLLGTVTGMIAAFQALQEAGNRADPAALAGGIWEALLTTAAGMAVAIPAQMALAWFDSIVDHLAEDMEDASTRILHAPNLQGAGDSEGFAKDAPSDPVRAAE